MTKLFFATGISLCVIGCASTSGVQTEVFEKNWAYCARSYSNQFTDCMKWQKSYPDYNKHQIALLNDVDQVERDFKLGYISKEQGYARIDYFMQYHHNQAVREARKSNCESLSALSSLGSGLGAMASSQSRTLGGALLDGAAGAGRSSRDCD